MSMLNVTARRLLARRFTSQLAATGDDKSKRFAVVDGKFTRVPANVPDVTEEITHTGQQYEEGDYRRNRFQERIKVVNQNWSIDMIAEVAPIEVEGRKAVCDGRDGPDAPAALGHPRVYINLDKKDEVGTCGYCGLRYIQKHH